MALLQSVVGFLWVLIIPEGWESQLQAVGMRLPRGHPQHELHHSAEAVWYPTVVQPRIKTVPCPQIWWEHWRVLDEMLNNSSISNVAFLQPLNNSLVIRLKTLVHSGTKHQYFILLCFDFFKDLLLAVMDVLCQIHCHIFRSDEYWHSFTHGVRCIHRNHTLCLYHTLSRMTTLFLHLSVKLSSPQLEPSN